MDTQTRGVIGNSTVKSESQNAVFPFGKSFEWRSCFWNPITRMLLTIYVDDFKLAGPKTPHEEYVEGIVGQHSAREVRGTAAVSRMQARTNRGDDLSPQKAVKG